MRVNEFDGGYVSMWEGVTPEAYKAQRMAELEQLAKYRAQRLKFFQDWADSEKREKIKAEAMIEELKAREIASTMKIESGPLRDLKDFVKITEIHRTVKKLPWWKRLFRR